MSKLTNAKQVELFLEQYDTFLFDCDGVLWLGNHLLPHVNETLELLRSRGKKLVFVTNNSTKSRQAYTKKFAKFGITVTANEIFGSAYSAAVYLDSVVKFAKNEKKVLILGEAGVEEELDSVGIKHVGGTDPSLNRDITEEDIANLKPDPSIGAVICGLDTKVNYLKIAKGMSQLQDKNTIFVATNIDSTYPTGGKLLPGAGTIVGTLVTCTGRNPVAVGKPSQTMMECIKAQFHFDPARTCMVGDRLNTDIQFGINGGLGTLLVLTGVDKEETILADNAPTVPKYYANKIGDLYEILNQNN